ncbi:hypothetical protein THAOC_21244 [Thalassiosira oceanica]|uniref:Uncharacterized protein n=1 Tax=Thalassiosira oceanica TaxID=159749 RepID=K0SJH7_THAOC|nr:hypothetical protein THAOC_21244 [Thalassiosira oceanica]|eukprot:EJK58617.1 hypothetical protein THAOC_21244 [Thalassiosira oceanica]
MLRRVARRRRTSSGLARPSKAPAAHDDSSDDEGEAEEDEGGDERQPSDDELAQKPKETEDIPDDGGGKQPAVMQPGIGHVPPSAEQQLSPEGNCDDGDKDGGDDEESGDEGITFSVNAPSEEKNADSRIPVSTVDDDDGDDGDDEDIDDVQLVQEDVDLSGGAQNRWGKNEPRVDEMPAAKNVMPWENIKRYMFVLRWECPNTMISV